uniref:EH domain-binding protein 1-like protein 1 isoform 1 n=1 Tax=Sus scrofa TaxID=9823 RepID=A0A480QAH5_PIG
MTSVWKRLQRVGKRAAKFQFVACYHELVVECTKKWQPDKLVVVWTRRNRRICSKAHSWQPGIQNPYRGTVVWMVPENVDISVTLYRDPHVDQYEAKEWTFVIENESKGQRKVLATAEVDLARHAGPVPAQVPLRLRLKPKSVKVVQAELSLTLSGVLLREGRATDDDMQSLASLMSMKPSDVGNLDDFAESDEEEANGPGAPEARARVSQPDTSRELKTLCEEEEEGRVQPQQAAASPSSVEDTSLAPVSAPAPPARSPRGQGSEAATVAGGQVGRKAPRPPGTPPEMRSSRHPGQDVAPTPAPRLRKGSDVPWPPVHQGEKEAPKASGTPSAGVDSAVETQAWASPQEGTEAQGAELGPGIEDRDSSNSLEGQKPKAEEGGLGDMPETSGVDTEHESGVREVSSPRSEVRAGKGEKSVEIGLVAAEQKSKVRHVDTKGAEATGVTSEARFKATPEAPPRGSQGRTAVRTRDEAPQVLGPPPAEPAGPSRHLDDLKGASAAARQEREGAEVWGRAPGVGGTGLEEGPSAGAASAGPQVSRCQEAPPVADQGAMSRGLRVWEVETGDSRVLGTETGVEESELLGTQETEVGGSGFPEAETETAQVEILGAQESEAADVAESEELGNQRTEAGGSGVLETKTWMSETELLGPQEKSGGSGGLKIEAETVESDILGAQGTEVRGSRVPEIEARGAEAEVLGTQEKELGHSGISEIKSEVRGTQETEVGGSEVLGFETDTAGTETLGTQETEIGGSGVPGMEAEAAEGETLGPQEMVAGGSGAPGIEAEILGLQEMVTGGSEAPGIEAEAAEAEALGPWKMVAEGSGVPGIEAETLGPQEMVAGGSGAPGIEAETLGPQEMVAGGSGVPGIGPEILGLQEMVAGGSGVPGVEAETLGPQEMEAGGSGVPGIEAEILGLQEMVAGGLEAPGIEAEAEEAEALGPWKMVAGGSEVPGIEAETLGPQEMVAGGSGAPGIEAEAEGAQETEVGDSGFSGPGLGMAEAEGLGTQQTETAVLEAEKAKARTSGVQEAESGLWGTLKYEGLRVPVIKHKVLGSQRAEGETTFLRGQEAEGGFWGVSEAMPEVWGAKEAEREVPGVSENQSGIFEAQEAEAGVSGTEKGKEAEGNLPEASLIEVQVASGAGAGVPSPSGASSPEEPEEDRRLPGSQVGMGAAEGPVCCFPLTWAERTAALHGPTWPAGVGRDRGSASRSPSPPPLSGCPGSPTLSSLGCMEGDTLKADFLEMWLLVTSDLARVGRGLTF